MLPNSTLFPLCFSRTERSFVHFDLSQRCKGHSKSGQRAVSEVAGLHSAPCCYLFDRWAENSHENRYRAVLTNVYILFSEWPIKKTLLHTIQTALHFHFCFSKWQLIFKCFCNCKFYANCIALLFTHSVKHISSLPVEFLGSRTLVFSTCTVSGWHFKETMPSNHMQINCWQ